jgi:hypothetical protein
MLRRIPAGGQRQRDRERGSSHAQHDTQHQDLGITVDPMQPGDDRPGKHNGLAQCPGPFGTNAIDEDSVDHTQERSGQDRNRDHQALLRCIEVKFSSDLHAQRAEQDPHHEANIEIEERRKQRRRVAGTEKSPIDHACLYFIGPRV